MRKLSYYVLGVLLFLVFVSPILLKDEVFFTPLLMFKKINIGDVEFSGDMFVSGDISSQNLSSFLIAVSKLVSRDSLFFLYLLIALISYMPLVAMLMLAFSDLFREWQKITISIAYISIIFVLVFFVFYDMIAMQMNKVPISFFIVLLLELYSILLAIRYIIYGKNSIKIIVIVSLLVLCAIYGDSLVKGLSDSLIGLNLAFALLLFVKYILLKKDKYYLFENIMKWVFIALYVAIWVLPILFVREFNSLVVFYKVLGGFLGLFFLIVNDMKRMELEGTGN